MFQEGFIASERSCGGAIISVFKMVFNLYTIFISENVLVIFINIIKLFTLTYFRSIDGNRSESSSGYLTLTIVDGGMSCLLSLWTYW